MSLGVSISRSEFMTSSIGSDNLTWDLLTICISKPVLEIALVDQEIESMALRVKSAKAVRIWVCA